MPMLVGAGRMQALWGELSTAHRRWIIVNGLVITALINLLVNAGVAWLSVIGQHRIPLWSVPLLDRPSTITDTVGTLFLLPLITCVLCTTAVWHDLAAGRLPPLRAATVVNALAAWLPATRLRRGLVLGAACTVALGPVAVLLLVLIDFANLTTGQFVLYKAMLGVSLGAAVTPAIAVVAMTGPLAPQQGAAFRRA